MEQVASPSRLPGSIGRLLREFRHRAYMSQETLAARAELSERTVRYLEADQVRSPRIDTVRLLADALQLSERERELWFDAAHRVNHEPAAFAAASPARLPYDAPAQPPLHARSVGRGNYTWRLRSPARTHGGEISELCHRARGSIGQVARDADVTDVAALACADQAGQVAETTDNGGLASADLRDLAELRQETRRLREDVEILKQIAAILATATRSPVKPRLPTEPCTTTSTG